MKNKINIVIVGMGKMGSRIFDQLSSHGVLVSGLSRGSKNYDEKIKESDVIFICTKQKDAIEWLGKYRKTINGKVLVSLVAGLNFHTLKMACVDSASLIVRIMSDLALNDLVWAYDRDSEDLTEVDGLMKIISKDARCVIKGKEEEIDRAVLEACEPGWLAHMLSEEVTALVSVGVDEERATALVDEKLSLIINMRQDGKSFSGITHQVATKGGLTEAGINEIDGELAKVFRRRILAGKGKLNEITNKYQLLVDTSIRN